MKEDTITGYLGEYMRWRGDLTFHQSPFCSVDSLALTMLSYLEPEKISEPGEKTDHITLRELSERYTRRYTAPQKPGKLSMMSKAPELLTLMASSRRFRNILLENYESCIDTELEGQFAAMTFYLKDYGIYITFRGTDNNMIGWKEDFNMSYLSSIPAQGSAVKYLKSQTAEGDRSVMLGGHSKGGNLAVYAAACVDESAAERIMEIHSFDGPGFSGDFFRTEGYGRIRDKIRHFMPQGSFVGKLFEHQGEIRIIQSTARGVVQHIPTNWKISGSDFIYAQEFEKSSRIFEDLAKGWLSGLKDEEKKLFIDTVFDILGGTEIQTTEELRSHLLKVRPVIRSARSLSKEQKDHVFRLLGILAKEAGSAARRNLFPQDSGDSEEEVKRIGEYLKIRK